MTPVPAGTSAHGGAHRHARRAPSPFRARPGSARGPRLALAAALLLAGCSSVTIRDFERPWARGDFPAAEEVIDRLVAEESGAELEAVRASRGLGDEVRPQAGDTALFLLEKGMCRLAAGDGQTAIDVWRRARDVMDERFASTDLAGYFGAVLTDDRSIAWVGADYEHLLVRTVIALADLVEGGEDALPFAFQISEKQEEIAGSTFGDDRDEQGNYRGYNPRKAYKRVPIGKYVEGVVLESERSFDEAAKAYATAGELAGGSALCDEGVQRCTGELRGPAGSGSVHVFYLAGLGPDLVETTSPVTDLALTLAQIGAIFGRVDLGLLAQAPVPVPAVIARQASVPPLDLRAAGERALTRPLLDVTRVASEQLAANMPWILARAVVRRAAKATATDAATDQIRDDGLALITKLLANLVWTATERADLRHWTSLPAEFQAAHLYLPDGTHVLDLGGGMEAPVRVRTGYSSFVLVLRPDLGLPGAVLVDVPSRVEAGTAAPAP